MEEIITLKGTEFETNPFTEYLIEHLATGTTRSGKAVLRYKAQFANQKGKEEQLTVVRNSTGEEADIGFHQMKLTDKENFTKIYIAHVGTLFELNKTGIRVLSFILTILEQGKDHVIFNTKDAIKKTKFKSSKSLYEGINQLTEAGIIARSTTSYKIFINPMIVFNGDRITFATTYIKEQNPNIKENNPLAMIQQFIDYK